VPENTIFDFLASSDFGVLQEAHVLKIILPHHSTFNGEFKKFSKAIGFLPDF
jgi:hypothetical protein